VEEEYRTRINGGGGEFEVKGQALEIIGDENVKVVVYAHFRPSVRLIIADP